MRGPPLGRTAHAFSTSAPYYVHGQARCRHRLIAEHAVQHSRPFGSSLPGSCTDHLACRPSPSARRSAYGHGAQAQALVVALRGHFRGVLVGRPGCDPSSFVRRSTAGQVTCGGPGLEGPPVASTMGAHRRGSSSDCGVRSGSRRTGDLALALKTPVAQDDLPRARDVSGQSPFWRGAR